MLRRTLLKTVAAAAGASLVRLPGASADEAPGVTATGIKIGSTMPYSGPLSAVATIGRAEAAFFRMVNDQGGVAGHKIDFLSLDDGFSPPKTVEQTRKLVEYENVAFMFGSLGTPTNTAVQKYLNDRKVPQLLIDTGADKWGNYKQFPWTMGWRPSYRVEARIYAKHILAHKRDAKIGMLYRNDDFGKDYLLGLKDVLGTRFDRMLVASATYEATDPTIDSQIVSLQSAGADTLIAAADPKFAAQAIRKAYEISWKPLFFLAYVSTSVGLVMRPVGPEKGIGIISAGFLKDPADPAWNRDQGMNDWRTFMAKYLPDGDVTDASYVVGYGSSLSLIRVLRQCNGDFSRANIMRQAADLHDVALPVLLPGIRLNTSPTNYHPIRQMQLMRWNGATWERFGEVIEGGEV